MLTTVVFVSNNILEGKAIRYSYREKSSIPQLNGWTLLSAEDNQAYLDNPKNFTVLGANSINKIAPVMLEIFAAPYGTDLCRLYEENIHVGFYDLTADKEADIRSIIRGQ